MVAYKLLVSLNILQVGWVSCQELKVSHLNTS